MIKFPYGLCDFYDIIKENYFYADRTDRIALIEDAGKHLLFIRPRRFGKSLLLSTLENYYDAAKANEFDSLFGYLAVGKNPTRLHNRYLVMKWDFSAICAAGTSQDIKKKLHNYINAKIHRFTVEYADFLPSSIRSIQDDSFSSFQYLLTAVSQTEYPLYLLIDEYDNFANEIMMGGRRESREDYESLVFGEGILKSLFKIIKAATAGQGLGRAFITGVSPIVLSDITSGHNIAENIYLKPKFNDLCGFTEQEIKDILREVIQGCDLPKEKLKEIFDMMKTFYNGYQFCYDAKTMIHNPTLALYFLKHFQETCAYPQKMLDSNLAPDRGKIAFISTLPNGEDTIMNALSGEKPVVVSELSDRFGIKDILHAPKDNIFMTSMLYYFGVLTLTGKRDEIGDMILNIPNLVIRRLYAESIREMLLPRSNEHNVLGRVARIFYKTGNMEELCSFIETTCFRIFDNRDYLHANELTIKTIFLTLLFNDTFYIMDSETAVERRYADLTMIVRPDMRQYALLDMLIEFKYVSVKETGRDGEKIRQMAQEELIKLAQVKTKLKESDIQAKAYGEKLAESYGGLLRLRIYSVVSIGFERLVWREIKMTQPG